MKPMKPSQELELVNQERQVVSSPPASPESDSARLLTMIERSASDPSVDVGKMERMFALYKEMIAAKELREFNAAMLRVQSAMPAVVRDSLNPSTNSKYAKLEKIQGVIAPLLEQNGFTISFGTDQSHLADHYGVTCLVSHGGHERLYRCDVPCDNLGMKGSPTKTKTHGFGSALSYGERYLLKLIFNVRLIGEDDDGNAANRPKPKGPSSMQPPDTTLKELARELWEVLKPVRGAEKNWELANRFMVDEMILTPEESAPNFTAEKFKEIIAKAKAKLKELGK